MLNVLQIFVPRCYCYSATVLSSFNEEWGSFLASLAPACSPESQSDARSLTRSPLCLPKTRVTERNLTSQPLPSPKLLSQASFRQYRSQLSQFSSLPHTSYPHRETVAVFPLHPSSQGRSNAPALKSASNTSRSQVGSDLQGMHLYPPTACKYWLARSLKKNK